MMLHKLTTRNVLIVGVLVLIAATGGFWLYAGSYGFSVLLRHGGTYWISLKADDARLSPSIRLALRGPPPVTAGSFEWRTLDPGFQVGELPVIAGGNEVDRILLARVDPARFRFEALNAPAGNRGLDQWMSSLGAALVINGSYYSRYGKPDTPLVSQGTLLGPQNYEARAGAFVASNAFVGIRNLAREDWRSVLRGADNGLVSYPLLVTNSPRHSPVVQSRWLANRSFVGQDKSGWIVFGTTSDAFFSLGRFADFLQAAPLDLVLALNLDGGPVACQAVNFKGFDRRVYGMWELQAEGDDVTLMTWPYGSMAMPVVLAVFPK